MMRGLHTPVRAIRRRVFKEVAQLGFKADADTLLADMEAIPYEIVNEELPLYPIYERCDLICYNTRVQNIEQSSYVKWYQQDKIVNIEVE